MYELPHIILLAHGSRDSRWCSTMEQGRDIIGGCLKEDVSLAYMEMATPGLDDVIAGQYGRGTRGFVMLPLFFAEGRHLLQDVPEQVTRLENQYEGINIELQVAMGRHEEFWQCLGAMLADQLRDSGWRESGFAENQGRH